MAYRRSGLDQPSWIAWAINPTSTGMIGSQALIALQRTDGSIVAYTSPITSYDTQLEQGNLSFPVHNISATYDNQEMIIFSTIQLPINTTVVNHVWQDGPMFENTPGIHGTSVAHVQCFGNLDFISGKVASITSAASSTSRLKIGHGAVNALSWGFLMPVGAIIARYVKVFQVADPAWFYLYVSCQSSAYVIGIGGGVFGFWLGRKSPGNTYRLHRDIGIALLCLACFQLVLARFFRPKKDHKLRVYWNICHYSVGYVTIILSIFNCFKGINILDSKKWTTAYMGTIIALGCVVVLLEALTRYIKIKSRRSYQNSCVANGVEKTSADSVAIV